MDLRKTWVVVCDDEDDRIDAAIAAAKLDGCWDVLGQNQCITRIDGEDGNADRLVSWITPGKERAAWDRFYTILLRVNPDLVVHGGEP